MPTPKPEELKSKIRELQSKADTYFRRAVRKTEAKQRLQQQLDNLKSI